MRASLALHTAARRYCLERHAYWSVRYAEIARRGADRERDGHGYTPEALDTFPRYHVLNAIRVELERIDPAGLGDFGAAKAGALRAGEMADDGFTRTPTGAIERRATAEERAAFCGYVAGLSAADLGGVEPLPYRRVLAAAEAGAVWARLREHWRMTEGFWYPQTGGPPGVVAFDAAAFDECGAFCRGAGWAACGSCASTGRSTSRTFRCSSRTTTGPKATGRRAPWVGSCTPRTRVP